MARKLVLVCDGCGAEIGDNKGGALRILFSDARKGSKVADVCDECAGKMPGKSAARRGRKPQTQE